MSVGAGKSVSSEDLPQFKSFVTESELEEKRKKRQEEWDRVRQPGQPEEAPEEEYDPRCLYDRLQEQKDKKQSELEEQFKLKNQVRGLDDDEAHFLDFVSDRSEEIEKKREQEDYEVIRELNKAMVTHAPGPSNEVKKSNARMPASGQKKSQSELLLGAVKRKRPSVDTSSEKKLKSDEHSDSLNQPSCSSQEPSSTVNQAINSSDHTPTDGRPQVIGILPGLGEYTDSSDSDSNTSDSDVDTTTFKRVIRASVSNTNQN